jgi:hypothetical protein
MAQETVEALLSEGEYTDVVFIEETEFNQNTQTNP